MGSPFLLKFPLQDGCASRLAHSRQAVANAAWLYCRDCIDRFFELGLRPHGLPHRDRASHALMRKLEEQEKVQCDTQEELECELESPEQQPSGEIGDGEECEVEHIDVAE